MEKGLIFTWLLAYGGSVLSIFRPFTGLLVYVCFAILKPEDMWYWSVQAGNYSRIIGLSLFTGWAIHGFGDWRLGKGGRVVGLLVAFLLWVGVSTLASPRPDRGLAYVEALAKVIIPVVIGVTLIDSVEKLKQLAWVIVLSQGYVAFELNLFYKQGFNRVTEIGFGGMDNNCVSIAMVAGMGLAFFVGLGAKSWPARIVAFVSALLMFHVVLISFSRGGMLGVIITGIVAFILIPKRPIHYACLVIAILIGLRLAGADVRERFFSMFADKEKRDESAQSRIIMWKGCWQEMCENPIFGIGPDMFQDVVVKYGYGKGKSAHTLWLQVGAELGFVGLGLLVGFYGLCMLRLWPYVRESRQVPDPWLRDTARMVIAALTGFAVSAQFVSLQGLELPYYIGMLGAGALKLLSRAEEETEAKERYEAAIREMRMRGQPLPMSGSPVVGGRLSIQ
jgi:probable O-glycosylation ligase (exosortase A-associated)